MDQFPTPVTLDAKATGDTTLHGLFAAAVEAWPAATAVVAGEEQLSYAALDAASAAVAAALRLRLGHSPLPPDTLVGLHVGRDARLLAGLLGILRAGGAYLPLEPGYPAERLRFMVQDSGLSAVVSDDPAAAAQLGLPPERVLLLDSLAETAPPLTPATSRPDDLAYVIYTSGSSGQPKGVAVPHRGVHNMALAHRDLLRIQAGDQVLLYASISFDASLAEIFPAFAAGATLHVADEAARRSPDALHALMLAEGINAATLMASVMGALPRRPLPALHSLMLAGETPAAETMAFWSAGRRLINAYGPTEASVSSCANIYQPGDPVNRIGRALPNTLLYVLDEDGAEVPVGASGELYIGGVGVARGYLNHPALTAERFLPNAFAPGRLYRSGDLVRRVAPDLLDYVGRRDFQVKIGGVRIEPDEIARALDALPGVAQSCVLPLTSGGAKVLTACYVADGADPGEASLRAALAAVLPAAMLPARFCRLEHLPLNNSGKVDRAELARQVEALERPRTAPASETERAIAALWCEALRLPAVGRDDNFYELGGDSLRLNWLLQRLNKAYGTRLVASRFRQLATLADLAEHVDSERARRTVEDF